MDMSRNWLIFEPHSDDAWLSLGNMILEHNDRVEIVTCSMNEFEYEKLGRRMSNIPWETNSLPNKVDVSVRLLAFPDLDFQLREEGLSDREYAEKYARVYSWKTLKYLDDRIIEIVNARQGWKVLAPLGIQHPFHCVISHLLKKHSPNYYVDMPYGIKQKNADIVREKSEGFLSLSGLGNSAKKLDIFFDVYRTQYHYYADLFPRLEEVILYRQEEI